MDGQYYNLWSTDNDRTDANDEVVIKSVYDPSPVGYSLPASNAFTGFTTTGNYSQTLSEYNIKGEFSKGYYFYTKKNKQGNTVFFPAWGYRYYNTGSLYRVPTYGYYWVAGPYNRNDGRYLHFSSGYVHPMDNTYRAFGYSVRSAEEKKTHKFNIKHEMDGQYYNLWSTDNDKTVPNDEVVIKSVYDPSPVGYSLPASNAFTGFTTTGGNEDNQPAQYNVKGSFDRGWYFYTKPSKKGNTFFFLSSGERVGSSGVLFVFSMYGSYWFATPYSNSKGLRLCFYSGLIYPRYNYDRSHGFTVRSAEEKKLKCGLKKIAKGVWVKGGL